MTRELLFEAIINVDENLITSYFEIETELRWEHRKKRMWMRLGGAIAACLVLCLCLFPIAQALVPAHQGAPITESYTSLSEAHVALGFDTLYTDVAQLGIKPSSVSISFREHDRKPLQLHWRMSVSGGTLHAYAIFVGSETEDSYIAGFIDQGIERELGGVTVEYCRYPTGKTIYSQARFAYRDVVYVIDLLTTDETVELWSYVEMLFSEIA